MNKFPDNIQNYNLYYHFKVCQTLLLIRNRENNILNKMSDDIFHLLISYLLWINPKVGEKCDVLDKFHEWHIGEIIEKKDNLCHISFIEWGDIFNEWIDLNEKQIYPLYSVIINWRDSLRIKMPIELLNKDNSINFGERSWFVGMVFKIKHTNKGQYIQILIKDRGFNRNFKLTDYISVYSSYISKFGTHLNKFYLNFFDSYIEYYEKSLSNQR